MSFEKIDNLIHREAGDESLMPFKKSQVGEKIGAGCFVKVHKIDTVEGKESGQVVKIGETAGISFPLCRAFRLRFPRKAVDTVLKKIFGDAFDLMPDEKAIERGIGEYAVIKEYFAGIDDNEKVPLNDISKNQREDFIDSVGDNSSDFYEAIMDIVGEEQFVEVVLPTVQKHQYANFLPKEQTVVGYPPDLTRKKAERLRAQGKKLPRTYYIFQDHVDGAGVKPLSELTQEDFNTHIELVEKLLIFALLTKKMYEDCGKLIDTRPEGMINSEWFQDTANILVDTESSNVSLIDTRFLWDRKMSFFGKDGHNLIERLGMQSVDGAIKKYTNILHELQEEEVINNVVEFNI